MAVFLTIVLDGCGIGEQPDAESYGDAGSDTLGHVCEFEQPKLPHLEALGLGRIRPLRGIAAVANPGASHGRMTEQSAGKDSTTGHWELAGIALDRPFPTYPAGFPRDIVDRFVSLTGCGNVLGNCAASGTEIIKEYGEEHLATHYPILYTSADSVFQVASHTDVYPVEALYALCQTARQDVCVGVHGVGRVIARPFEGSPGEFRRISAKRKDFSRLPVAPTVQESLQGMGVRTVSIGKIYDLFGGVGFDESWKTKSNTDGIRQTIDVLGKASVAQESTFIWVNLVDFDQEFGHRNNPKGFADALMAFDESLPGILEALPVDSRLCITADHGNDPTTPSTDHSREYVPLLYYGSPATVDLGTRSTFRDHAATIAAYFGVDYDSGGTAFEPV